MSMGLVTDQATGQPACTNYVFTASGHAASLLTAMRQLRENDNLCDVTLCAEQEEYKAHRLVLAACSPYFNAMFNNQHLESSSSRVELNGMEGRALGALIDYAYTSSLVICQESVQGIMAAANHLQITDVVDACCNFLLDQIDAENCLGIAAFAEMLSCRHLQNTSWQFALENFHELCRTEEFLSTPVSLLKQLVESESLNVSSEEEVLECVLRWYGHDRELRSKSVCSVLHHVKLPLIPWSLLNERLNSDPILTSQDEYHVLMAHARSVRLFPDGTDQYADSVGCSQCVPRKSVGQSPFLYVVGGETTPGRSTVRSIERYNPGKNSWNTLAPMSICRRGVGTALLNGLLYVVGGSSGVQALRTVECYDPHSNSWTQLADMLQERSSVAVVSLDNAIYAVGGYDGITSCLRSVEQYDPVLNVWTNVSEMCIARSMHDVAVLNKKVYVVGGYDGGGDLASCEVYTPDLDQWELIQDMHSPRCMAGVGVVGNLLFVVGGCDCSQNLSSVEVYSVEEGEWKVVANMAENRSGHGVGVVGKKLYALGGYRGSDEGYSSSVECYDVENNSWTIVGSMAAERRRFGCS